MMYQQNHICHLSSRAPPHSHPVPYLVHTCTAAPRGRCC